MGTFIKALVISASIVGLTNVAAMAAETGPQAEAACTGVSDKAKKQLSEEEEAAKKKSAEANSAKGGKKK